MNCDQARELIPFYAARSLPQPDGTALIAHVVECGSCQEDLVETVRLSQELRGVFARLPGLPQGTWLSVAARTLGAPVLQLRLGPEAMGLTLEVGATKAWVPITGRLSVLGRDVPVLRI